MHDSIQKTYTGETVGKFRRHHRQGTLGNSDSCNSNMRHNNKFWLGTLLEAYLYRPWLIPHELGTRAHTSVMSWTCFCRFSISWCSSITLVSALETCCTASSWPWILVLSSLCNLVGNTTIRANHSRFTNHSQTGPERSVDLCVSC